MVTAMSAVGNGGKLMKPYVVKEITDSEGNVVETRTPVVKRQAVSEAVTQKVIDAMEENAKNGSAKNGYVAGYRVAGKTGTSEKKIYNSDGSQQYIASFADLLLQMTHRFVYLYILIRQQVTATMVVPLQLLYFLIL